jgi:hypothetical protein
MDDEEIIINEVYKILSKHIGFHDLDKSVKEIIQMMNYKDRTVYFGINGVDICIKVNESWKRNSPVPNRTRTILGPMAFPMGDPNCFDNIEDFIVSHKKEFDI